MMRIRTGILLCALSLPLGGCFGEETVAAIVTSISGHESDGSLIASGSICVPVVGDGHDVGSNFSGETWALRGLSSRGSYDQALYVRPPGMPEVEVDENTGELAMEWSFGADSIAEGEWEIDEMVTHHGETMFVSHWSTDADCDDPTAPEGYEIPGL